MARKASKVSVTSKVDKIPRAETKQTRTKFTSMMRKEFKAAFTKTIEEWLIKCKKLVKLPEPATEYMLCEIYETQFTKAEKYGFWSNTSKKTRKDGCYLSAK